MWQYWRQKHLHTDASHIDHLYSYLIAYGFDLLHRIKKQLLCRLPAETLDMKNHLGACELLMKYTRSIRSPIFHTRLSCTALQGAGAYGLVICVPSICHCCTTLQLRYSLLKCVCACFLRLWNFITYNGTSYWAVITTICLSFPIAQRHLMLYIFSMPIALNNLSQTFLSWNVNMCVFMTYSPFWKATTATSCMTNGSSGAMLRAWLKKRSASLELLVRPYSRPM